MTSSGHVTMPEAIPADAPHKALAVEFGRRAKLTTRLEKGEFVRWLRDETWWEESVVGTGAYRFLCVVRGDGCSGALVDMMRAVHVNHG